MKVDNLIEAELNIFTTLIAIWLIFFGLGVAMLVFTCSVMVVLYLIEVEFTYRNTEAWLNLFSAIYFYSIFIILTAHSVLLGSLKFIKWSNENTRHHRPNG